MKPLFQFIACTNDALMMEECKRYIRRLYAPDGWRVEITEITDAASMTSGYNRAAKLRLGDAPRTEDAPIRIYLHHDVFILNRWFLHHLLRIFTENKDVGMIGMVGTPALHPTGVMWVGSYVGGLYEPTDAPYVEDLPEDDRLVTDVEATDGFLMATRVDIPWREDLFDGFDFYDVSQGFEFRKNGWRVVTPEQNAPWCVHDGGKVMALQNYNRYRKIFLKNYMPQAEN